MSKRNFFAVDAAPVVNNLKLVFSDSYLDYRDVTIIVRNKPALVRRILRTCNAYAEAGVKQDGFNYLFQGDLYARECLESIVFEYLNTDGDAFFSRSQKRRINRLPHPVLSGFNFY